MAMARGWGGWAGAAGQAGALLETEHAGDAGGMFPVEQDLNSDHRNRLRVHMNTLVHGYLAAQLPLVTSMAGAAALVGLAPTFTGNWRELFGTVDTLTR
jgi:hypothetical protein